MTITVPSEYISKLEEREDDSLEDIASSERDPISEIEEIMESEEGGGYQRS